VGKKDFSWRDASDGKKDNNKQWQAKQQDEQAKQNIKQPL
jgi:hypothetical protein